MLKAALHNLGCKVNDYETQAMEGMLKNAGYEIVDFHKQADVYVVNTCSVTTIADRKSRQMLHRAKKLNPHSIVIACGCYVQQAGEALLEDSSIDIIIGNNEKHKLIDLIDSYRLSGKNKLFKESLLKETEFEEIYLEKPGDHVRAYIKIQDGCNRFCTYCIIPFTRGGIRSRKPEDVLREVDRLAKAGYKEIVLTGIHISSYGLDLQMKDALIELIEKLHSVDGIERIRLGSLEPLIVTDEFAKRLSSLDKICPHFHLSLQSGSDGVLKRMNRRYTSLEYATGVETLRKYFELPSLTTDIIVGFPGESQAEFEETVDFVEKIDFFETHIFKFSGRPGTKANDMPNQIDGNLKQERSARLLEINDKHRNAYMQAHLGKEVSVLVEELVEDDFQGLTPNYLPIRVRGVGIHINDVIRVKVEAIENGYLRGSLLS